MKVLLDVSVFAASLFSNKARTGIFRVVDNLAIGLRNSPGINLHLTSPNSPIEEQALKMYIEGGAVENENVEYYPERKRERRFFKYVTQQSIKNRWIRRISYKAGIFHTVAYRKNWKEGLVEEAFDIYHSPHQGIPRELYNSKLANTKKFFTCYDLLPIIHPEYFPKEFNPVASAISKLHVDTWVSCISENTRNDFLNFRKDFDEERVSVAPLAASDIFYPNPDAKILENNLKKLGIPTENPYLLSVSTLEPRKNLDLLIRAFSLVVKQQRQVDLNLVLVGTKGWDFEEVFVESLAPEIIGRVYFTDYVPDSFLSSIYSGALAFVYPSKYEGFGLPPLEAMQCGAPVITSNTSSLPEVVGNVGLAIDPTSVEDLADAIMKVYQDNDLRLSMSKKSLERSKLFTWRNFTEKTIDAYNFALGR